ncbi:Protein of unknown function [Flexibacter flexilis DSM 6793]|uniref:DUF2834 domain-containing protein n=1 Tax=Flexibacter flexilis DSM 6793 TaxID=927664 RepID=A0A1I1D913_9BACT|nr:DUF2834 domain-containing protein [Flexibacter flexilis]SFB71509.1 Protein of unknown function [Flexibacter flexilis DSM 6793]
MKNIYLLLAAIGTLLPLSQFYQFLAVNGLDIPLFFEQLFANKISSFFAMDVLVSAAVTVSLIVVETKRIGIKNTWICYVGLFLAGVSCGLPLFLFLREKSLEKRAN